MSIAKFLILLFIPLGFQFCVPKEQSHTEKVQSVIDSLQVVSVQESSKHVVAFVYHRFGDPRYPSTNVGLRDFESQLQYLKNENYKVLAFTDAVRYLQDDRAKMDKVACLTIDDGYESFYKDGWPLLKKYGISATMFLNTSTVGNGGYCDWLQVKEMMEEGLEIGNHTHSHQYFLDLPIEERYQVFEGELLQSQDIIEEQLGVKPRVFAYPFGEYDLEMKKIVCKHFQAAAAQHSGVMHSESDSWLLPRFPISERYAESFISKAQMLPMLVSGTEGISPLLGDDRSPPLRLKVKSKGLQIQRAQCFVQAGGCTLGVRDSSLNITPMNAIAGRRRTLYTITVPDTLSRWHWYSWLWIDPAVR